MPGKGQSECFRSLASTQREAGGLYVHLPFCPYLCPYCDFAKWQHDGAAAQRYLRALEGEIAGAPAFAATTLFYGGGTPNTYPAEQIARLTATFALHFDLPSGAEATIEINPDEALCNGFEIYRRAGINRLSIGVQSFIESELRALGRQHTAADVAHAVRAARTAGFTNISLDLIFGAPGQTLASWVTNLGRAIDLGVEHVSAYGLTIEAGTPYERWYARTPEAFPDSDQQAEFYGAAIDILTAAGFEHYEISNFARPGFRCAHNANYWANGPYLGLGVGATSYLAGERRTSTRDLSEYEAAALSGSRIPAERERLEGSARVGEAAMLALRTAEGVDFQSFAERYDVDFKAMFSSVLNDLSAAGLVTIGSAGVALTRRGRLLANDVCGAFLAPA
jgi:oxygen-independent coproporphyrinogen III oxidase